MKMIRKQLLLRIGVALLATLAAAYLYVQLRSVGIAASKSGPERISAHVYVVKEGRRGAMSNVGFVVGDAAALVIDSGLGSRNGRILAGELQRIAANRSIISTRNTCWANRRLPLRQRCCAQPPNNGTSTSTDASS